MLLVLIVQIACSPHGRIELARHGARGRLRFLDAACELLHALFGGAQG
ncbi:hypothetical protein [Pandoraea anapnoica]|nr:hypothetical protein [Pandoraea anapnoica]